MKICHNPEQNKVNKSKYQKMICRKLQQHCLALIAAPIARIKCLHYRISDLIWDHLTDTFK